MPIKYTGNKVVLTKYRNKRGHTTRVTKRYTNKLGRNLVFRKAKAGGRPLIVPLKASYQYTLSGGGSSPVINFDYNASMANLPNPDWFSRYYPMFQMVRLNKVRFKIICPYNIGQANVGRATLYKIWSKKATTLGEVAPGNETEWLNMQNAKQTVFSSKTNSLNYYFTPYYEAPQSATVAKRLMYKAWWEMPNGPTQCVEHGGMIGSIMAVDGQNIAATEKFTVQVTLYLQFKGLKQL